MAKTENTKRKGGTIMVLKNEQMTQAEYDRFIDFMAQMYLKYGSRYQKITGEDVLKLFPNPPFKKNVHLNKGAYLKKGA